MLACWQSISAPALWVEGKQSDLRKRYGDDELAVRLAMIPNLERACFDHCGHIVHRDRPEALAACIERFLG